MERDSPQEAVTVASNLATPPPTFYANDNPKSWTVSIISRGLRVAESGCKESRSVLKQEMEKRHLIGYSLNTSENQEKLSGALRHLEASFPLVFTADIPRRWLDSCELGMARKINYTHVHYCNRRRRTIQHTSIGSTTSETLSCPLSLARLFYVESKRTKAHTLFSPTEITRVQKPLFHVGADEIDFGLFKELLKEHKVYDSMVDRIMCRIGDRDIEIDQSRIFKTAALSLYERGQDPISFTTEAYPMGKCVQSISLSIASNVSQGRQTRAKLRQSMLKP